jgi:hypothetical protein
VSLDSGRTCARRGWFYFTAHLEWGDGTAERKLTPACCPRATAAMSLSRKKATTIALDPACDRLLTPAARERGVSRSEFIRQPLALVLVVHPTNPDPGMSNIT